MEEQELQHSNPEVAEANEQQPPNEQRHTRHFNEMRKKLDAEESARKAAEQRAYDLEQRLNQMQPQSTQQQAVDEEDIQVDNEDYIQAKYVKTSNKKLRTKMSATEQKLADLEKKLEYMEAKVDTDAIKDFTEVVNDENIKTFARLYPDDYQSMLSNPNFKARSRTAYNMIKNYGIADTTSQNRSFVDADKKMTANKQKPQSASLTAPQTPQTPLTRLEDYDRRWMTESDRDRILAEVKRKKELW